MKAILRQFRPFDFVLIGLALLLSFSPPLVTAFVYNQSNHQESQLVAIVKINGQVVDEWPLDTGLDKERNYYPNQGQYKHFQSKDSSIHVKENNSPEQMAVNT